MTKRSIIILLGVFLSIAVFAVRTQSETGGSNQTAQSHNAELLRNIIPAEMKREATKRRKQRELESEQRQREFKKKLDEIRQKRKMRKEMWEKQKEEAGGFIHQKYALGASEEQWKVIKAKLEKVRLLREQARSTVGVSLTSSSGSGKSSWDRASRKVPTWQWKQPWKDKAPGELTESQKLAKQLIVLVENNNTAPEQFRRKMDALRKARSKEAEIERQLAEAQEELREVLTTRQEAALVLMKWL